MRFMVLLKADKTTEAGVLPTEERLAEMGKYNEQLVNAGVLLMMPVPGVGWLACVKDPDGNDVGLPQPDEAAA